MSIVYEKCKECKGTGQVEARKPTYRKRVKDGRWILWCDQGMDPPALLCRYGSEEDARDDIPDGLRGDDFWVTESRT